MKIEDVQADREKWLTWKNIAPLREKLNSLPKIKSSYSLDKTITINSNITQKDQDQFYSFAMDLRPWRKGPFKIVDTFIDSEWQSFIKYSIIEHHFDITDKIVADIGCNNGYYMFRMLEKKPKKIIGFDPSPLYKTQFDFINHFLDSDIIYEMLGVEHLEFYKQKFDVIFCLGVLYHRSDPIATLKSLKKGLNKSGELYLDTFMIDGSEDIALTPQKTYSKIPNIYFIPTISALSNWCIRAGFKTIDILEIKETDEKEQRKTKWIEGESLGDFLDPNNKNVTVEGYPAPKRVYIRARL